MAVFAQAPSWPFFGLVNGSGSVVSRPVLSHHLRLLDPVMRPRHRGHGLSGCGSSANSRPHWGTCSASGFEEKSHADYFGVALARYIAEKLAIYDLRKCGRLLEMKNRFCDDDGMIANLTIFLCGTNHRTFRDLSHRFLAYGGGLTLAVRIFLGDGSVRVQ